MHGGRVLGENEQNLKLLAERLALDGFPGKSDFLNDGLHVFRRLGCEGGHQPGDCEIDQSSERADALRWDSQQPALCIIHCGVQALKVDDIPGSEQKTGYHAENGPLFVHAFLENTQDNRWEK